MMKILLAASLGLLTTLAWLAASFYLGFAVGWLSWLNAVAFGPADIIKRKVLPQWATAAVMGADGPASHHGMLLLLSMILWWMVWSIAWALALRWVAPNNSFKPNPLRGSA